MKLDIIRQQQRFNEARFCVDGRLYLFEDSQVTVLESWPKLRAWRRLAGSKRFERTDPTVMIHGLGLSLDWLKQWEVPHEPFSAESTNIWHASQYNETEKSHEFRYFRIGLTSDDPEAILASERFDDFIEAIPQPVLSRITRFTYGQWRLAGLCSRIPEFLELIDSHPALAFALVHAEHFRDQPTPSLASLRNKIRLAPVKLAAWLGFPESLETVAILQKILPSACHLEWLLKLRRQYFSEPEPLLLRQLVLIDQPTLALLVGRTKLGLRRKYSEIVSEEFIIEFAALDKGNRSAEFGRIECANGPIARIADMHGFDFDYEVAAHSILFGRHGDWDDDEHLAYFLPEPPDFLTPLDGGNAPAWTLARRFQFAGCKHVLVVRPTRLNFEGDGCYDSMESNHDALVAWVAAGLRRMHAGKIDQNKLNHGLVVIGIGFMVIKNIHDSLGIKVFVNFIFHPSS